MTNGRKVKSRKLKSVDGHEGRKDFLSPDEIESLLEAAKGSRQETRDHLLMLIMYRHGLRISEALRLRVKRVVNSKPPLHKLSS